MTVAEKLYQQAEAQSILARDEAQDVKYQRPSPSSLQRAADAARRAELIAAFAATYEDHDADLFSALSMFCAECSDTSEGRALFTILRTIRRG